jgi:hypothetical protein
MPAHFGDWRVFGGSRALVGCLAYLLHLSCAMRLHDAARIYPMQHLLHLQGTWQGSHRNLVLHFCYLVCFLLDTGCAPVQVSIQGLKPRFVSNAGMAKSDPIVVQLPDWAMRPLR